MRFIPGFWRKCRTTFRWCRFAIWFTVLAALCLLGWCNRVGLPDFLKTRLVATLQERGVNLEFSRMRLRLIRGFVAENVVFSDKNNSARPVLTAVEIQLQLNYAALLHRRFQLDGVRLRQGQFTLPVSPTNSLVLSNLQAEVRFLPDDSWSLDELRADFSGAQFRLSGQVAHAPAAAKWEVFAGPKTGGQGALGQPLRDFASALEKIHFTRPPQISATLAGDARDVHSFTLRLNVNAPGVATPWFAARELQLAANLTAPVATPTNFDATLDFWTNALPFRLAWTSRATRLDLKKFEAGGVACSGLWNAPQLAVTELSAQFAGGRISAAATLDAATRELRFTNDSAFDAHALKLFLPENMRGWLADVLWTQPPALAVNGSVRLPAWTNREPDWRELAGPTAQLHGGFACTNAVVRGRTVELARTHFDYADGIWNAPDLQLRSGRTRLEFSGSQSAVTDNFRGRLHGSIDTETVRTFLPTNIAEPLFQIVTVAEPVALDVTASGNWRRFENFMVTGQVAITNVAVREQAYESVAADFTYTNRVLSFLHPQSLRAHGTQTMTADAVVLDWNAGMYFFSNGYSTTEPMALIRCIGPKTAALIAPYEFPKPPTARVHGQLPLREINRGKDLVGTDMTFEIIEGTPFRWTKLSSTNATATVHWLGQELIITNVAATLYGGNGTGGAYFDFHSTNYGCDFSFYLAVTNVDVQALGMDLSDSKSNLIEGSLTGHAVVTDANSETWRSWNGYGHAYLRDGLLWNIPIFGLFSPALNTVTPGLGNSRATDASASFFMTNGVIHSDRMEIQTLTMRLIYDGTVDLGGTVDARVTAQLLRNTPLIGSVVSLVLMPVSKIFECQVHGKVSDPQVTPIYFPFSKYLLSPVRTFEQMLPAAEKPR